MTVSEFAEVLGVTSTAVRQRLQRLLGQELISRDTSGSGRGRPRHEYRLTDKGQRTAGSNFGDLALALWQEIRSIDVPEVRRGLLQRIATRMAEMYAGRIQGDNAVDRMKSLAELFGGDRQVPFQVQSDGGLPVLNALSCPYPDLAEQDRSICSMERMMFAELLGDSVKLSQCRLDGDTCCTFAVNSE